MERGYQGNETVGDKRQETLGRYIAVWATINDDRIQERDFEVFEI